MARQITIRGVTPEAGFQWGRRGEKNPLRLRRNRLRRPGNGRKIRGIE